MSGGAMLTLSQTAFRFYGDGTESGSTALAAQNTNHSLTVDSNQIIQLRVRIQESGGAAGATTDDYQLQVSKAGGAYANVAAASSNVRGYNSASLTDGDLTTNRLGAGSGSFVAGEISEDGLVDDRQITASNYTELLFSLELVAADLVHGNTLDFRVLHNGATITYSVTPRLTANKTPVITSTSTGSVAENATLAKTLTATNGGAFSIVGGADSAQFQISSGGGTFLQWSANGTRNYEAPADADANNQYVVTVRAQNSAGLFADQTITITVTDAPGPGATDWSPSGTPSIASSTPFGEYVGSLNKDSLSSLAIVGGTNSGEFALVTDELGGYFIQTNAAPLTAGTSTLQIRDTTNGPAGSGEDRTDTLSITVTSSTPEYLYKGAGNRASHYVGAAANDTGRYLGIKAGIYPS